jgi:hypothetical protein
MKVNGGLSAMGDRVSCRLLLVADLSAANIQLFGSDDDAPDDFARRIAKAVKETLAADGFGPVPAGEASDRELAIVISTSKGRATVLDEAGDRDRETLETLARQLSQALGVLAVSVHGSPATPTIGLHGGGMTLSSLPEDAKEETLHEAWGELLVGGNTPKDLKDVWFARGNPLTRTAEILTIESSLITVNHAALGRLGRAGVRLRFKGSGEMTTASGPRLRAASLPGQKISPPPGEVFPVHVVVQNKGAPGTGVDVTLRGRILSEEWLEVRSVALTTGGFKEEQRPRFRVVRNDRVFQARFDKAPLAGAGAPEILTVSLQCQLTRHLPSAEPLQVSLEPVGSSSGGCSIDVPIFPRK